MASERDPRPGDGAAAPAKGDRVPIRLIVVGLLGLYLLLFAVLNAKTVKVSFVFFSTRISLIVALALAAVLGFLAGYLGREIGERRRRRAKS